MPFALCAFLLMAGGAPHAAPVDTTFTLQRGGEVAVFATSRNVSIHRGATSTVTVLGDSRRGRIRFDVSSQRLTVEVGSEGDGPLQITVPAGARITVRSTSGDVTVSGTGGDVSAHTNSGDLHVDSAEGHVDLSTLSGDITAATLKGTVTAHSISGDIAMNDVTGIVTGSSVSGSVSLHAVTSQSVDAHTTSGDIVFDGPIDPAGRYSFATHLGDVTVDLPANASAQLTVSTWSGSIDSAFPITLQPGEHDIGLGTSKRFTFTIGGGDARINAETFSGDVQIRRHGR